MDPRMRKFSRLEGGPKMCYLAFIWLILSCPNYSHAKVKLPRIFNQNMVLQRSQPIVVWGWADAGEHITLGFHRQNRQVRANSTGHWSVTFDSEEAGGPYQLSVSATNEITLDNILVGDVWLCSGQSNMQWQIHQTPYRETDTAWISQNQIRLFTVHIDTDYLPREDLLGGTWENLSAESIHHFSAVAYHFGKTLHDSLSVPIGLISSNLGATSIETWMSNEALMSFEQFRPEIEPILEAGKNFAQIRSAQKEILPKWKKEFYCKGPGIQGKWYHPDLNDSSWMDFTGPGIWEEHGLSDHDGAVWFRNTFNLPADFVADSFSIALSQLDDYDITWVNGHKIGSTFGRHNHRNYKFPTAICQPQGNQIAVRIFDIGGKGGFTTDAFWTSPLVRSKWKMKKGLVIDKNKIPPLPVVNVTPFSSPAVLFNANIAPLRRFQLKGFVWYQGEANTSRAVEYGDLFPALINDWRKQWQKPDLPFLFVQLANYRSEDLVPKASAWAELREAQAHALRLNNTGCAVAIDIGEADDIHPRNKFEVGRRLALAGLKIAYDKDLIYRGPTYHSSFVSGNKIIVTMECDGSTLRSNNKYGYVPGFAIAGPDRKFKWARAEIADQKIHVWSPTISEPVAVRYGWSDNPGLLDLSNQEGLPAAPFRTDDWPLSTSGLVYDPEQPRF